MSEFLGDETPEMTTTHVHFRVYTCVLYIHTNNKEINITARDS